MNNPWKRRLIVIAILLIILLGLFFLTRGLWQNGASQKYRVVKIERGDISFVVTATGTINPVVTVLVGSQVSGTIKALYADFNSQVKQGQLIAQIDPAIFDAQVEQARANVLNAQANLENTKANLVKAEVAVLDAKRNLDRNKPLLERQVIAQATLDTAQVNYDTAVAQQEVAKAQIESAKAQVEQMKAALSMAETNLRYTIIRSPVNGTVISRNVDVGQTVAASLQAPTLFSIAKDLTKMQVDTNVSEADVGRITVGQDSTFTVDAYPERMFRGKVTEIRDAPITIQNVVTYDVVIQVDNSDLKLKPGMTANVSVLVSQREGVLKIPNTALRFQPTSAKKGSGKGSPPQKPSEQTKGEQGRPGRVWILSPEGKPVSVSITLGISDGTFSELVSGDLREGIEVIVEELSNKKGSQSGSSSPFMPRRP